LRRPFLEVHDPDIRTRNAIADIVADILLWIVSEFGEGDLAITDAETKHTSKLRVEYWRELPCTSKSITDTFKSGPNPSAGPRIGES
jgi:hypothetical protein